MNELILSQLNNQAPNANRAVGSIKTVEKSASRTIVSLDGNSLPILSGAYTGNESAVFDIEIDSLTVTTPIVSAVIEKISGDGSIESVSVDPGATAETITITLNNLGTDERAASVDIYNRTIQAQITGAGGNTLSIAVDESGLVFTPSTYTLLKSLSAGSERMTGIEYNLGGLSLDSRGQIQSGTQRFSFRGYPGIYRQYREFANGEHVYVFTPKIAYAIPEGTPIDIVTGSREVTVLDAGVVQETFPGIVTLFDFFNALDTASTLVEVAGAVVEDKLPGGDSVIDLDLVTHSIALPISATGSTYAKTLDDVTVAVDAPTQIIEIECTDNGDMGDEIWKVTGNLSGALGNAISGTPFTSAVCGFTVPEKTLPVTGGVSGVYIPTGRDIGESIPSVCVNYVKALKNAENGTYTFEYRPRPAAACTPCSTNDGSPATGNCAGNPEEQNNVLDYRHQLRQGRLARWLRDFSHNNTAIIDGSPTATESELSAEQWDLALAKDAHNILLTLLKTLFDGSSIIFNPARADDTEYEEGAAVVFPGFDRVYRASNTGTSGSGLPVFTPGDETVTDGDIIWLDMGLTPLAAWDALFIDVQNDLDAIGSPVSFNPDWATSTIITNGYLLDNVASLKRFMASVPFIADASLASYYSKPKYATTTMYAMNAAIRGIYSSGRVYKATGFNVGTPALNYNQATLYIDADPNPNALNSIIDGGAGNYRAKIVQASIPFNGTFAIGDYIRVNVPNGTGYPTSGYRLGIGICTAGGTHSNPYFHTLATNTVGQSFTAGTATFDLIGLNYTSGSTTYYAAGIYSGATQPAFTGSPVNDDNPALQWIAQAADNRDITTRVNQEVISLGDYRAFVIAGVQVIMLATVAGTTDVDDSAFTALSSFTALDTIVDGTATWEIQGTGTNLSYVRGIASGAFSPSFTGNPVADSNPQISWVLDNATTATPVIPLRSNSEVISLGDYRQMTAGGKTISLLATVAGTTDAGDAPFASALAIGATPTDGTVTWEVVGAVVNNADTPGVYTGASSPVFTDPSPIAEGYISWVFQQTFSASTNLVLTQTSYEAFSAYYIQRYETDAQLALSNAQVNLSPKDDASLVEVAECWQDEGDGFWWEYTGDEGYLPAFTNDGYYSVKRDDKGKIYSTKEFYFYIAVSESCAGALKEGDQIKITIKDAQRTYQIGDLFRLPIVYSAPLALTDGQTGDNLNTWKVKGSISGALTDYIVEHDNELDYALHDLHFTIFRGDIPYLVGDSYEFSISGGTFQWRKDGGAWNAGVDIAPIVALSDGLSIEFPPAAAPQFVIGDSWQFTVRQPYAVSNMSVPTLDYYDSGVTGVDVILSWASLTQIDIIALAGHDLSGLAILYSADGGTTQIPAVVTEGVVISAPVGIPIDWVSITSTAGSRIAWLFAGTSFSASICVEQTIGWSNTLDKGERSANWQYGGLDGELNYRIIPNADYLQLKAIFQNAKENGDWPVMYFPNKNIPEESGTCRFTDNRLAVSDFRRFGNPTTTNRRLSTKVTLEHYSFSAD